MHTKFQLKNTKRKGLLWRTNFNSEDNVNMSIKKQGKRMLTDFNCLRTVFSGGNL
jgi:hypothetical protein